MKVNLWLANKYYDLFFFHFSAFVGLVTLGFYFYFGPTAGFAIYLAQSILAGAPHVYLSFLSLAPKSTRNFYQMRPVYITILLASIFGILIIVFREQFISNLIISFIHFFACWHTSRQHYGISKIYDHVLSVRLNDPSLKSDLKPLYIFFGLCFNAAILYGLTLPEIHYMVARNWTIELIYPHISNEFFWIYFVASLLFGVWAIKKSVYDRFKRGRSILLPQYLILFNSIFMSLILYLLLPKSSYIFMWLIPTLGHNIQYFGFVWLFERKRSVVLEKTGVKAFGISKLIKNNNWFLYFSIVYFISLLTISLGLFFNLTALAIGITYFATLFHYAGDGLIWKKNINLHVTPVTKEFLI